jgi:Rrf2 family nitric oxide-sensitive transcriptional repressor
MRLARPAEAIAIGEVVRLTEPDFALVECFTGRTTCKLDGRCALATTLGDARDAFLAVLDTRTLAEVAAPGPRRPALAPITLARRAAAAGERRLTPS